MLEESLPSIWASLHSWLTPTVLFILLNVVIGTIAFSSSTHKRPNDKTNNKTPLPRTSSVLERIRSFNLHRQNTPDLPPLTTTLDPQPQTVETIGPEDPTAEYVPDPQPEEAAVDTHFSRSRSDTHPTAGELPEKLARKIKKSASAKSAFGHFEEEEIVEAVQRPATMRERKVVGEDEEVDAKADDFINKFKQQLKLQRLDSITRYKEMINREK
ncbi:hypothetical protein MRB53_012757 [Persea americana]|uniref:Uncharacterized protein n=1 Tax=Persea americana TaxID=3435 RepID=A0ACC2LYL8_PERAE|nr:hypothetical protein MRB53_012757 [Persea americana]|eukprot:TRINITY_DN6821_c0_g3_i1.p1 TRINITY_DN6821_c0_g3~~TRINITY_DN6821_c0_g3_i1.p1  ORF type:complete len:214 (+),score=28.60 TRINITY_DN6821_c0_g3_i1:82-723(+)